VDRTLWRLGCRNRPILACRDNKPGSNDDWSKMKRKKCGDRLASLLVNGIASTFEWLD